MSNWTHYWQRDTVLDEMARSSSSTLDHLASNVFRARGVDLGDHVYVISNFGGSFHVIGRLVVDRIVDQRTAAKELPYQPWSAEDHLMAAKNKRTAMRFDVTLPLSVVRKLQFVSKAGIVLPKLTAAGTPDRQTFRGVREITNSTAAIFDRALGLAS